MNSKAELEDIKQYALKLRADLAATNQALMAVLTSMPAAQQQQALAKMAELSARKQQLAETLATQAQRDTLKPLQEAEERLFQALQGACKLWPGNAG